MTEWLVPGSPDWIGVAGGLALALLVAYAVSALVARFIRAGLSMVLKGSARDLRSPAVRRPIRVIRIAVFFITAIILGLPGLRLGGIESEIGPRPEALLHWLLTSGLRIALIILVGYAVIWLSGTLIRRMETEIAKDTAVAFEDRVKRVRTLGGLLQNGIGIAISSAALLMVLRELNVDITPILTGAGIVGLAVGFGAQTLVKDVITGFFLILENQIRVGDVAVINGVNGLVEAINLRTIVLRDLEGAVHIFPNGSIATLSNRTKDYSYAVVDVTVALAEDLDRVSGILRRVGAELADDPEFGPRLLEPLEVLGVDALDTTQATIKVRVKTLPRRQWEVARELRRRIKVAFDSERVQRPSPLVAVSVSQTPRPRDEPAAARLADRREPKVE
jgi:small conductance mechanosensitive channel